MVKPGLGLIIKNLRESGFSISEIATKVCCSKSTVSRLSKSAILSTEAKSILEAKRFPAQVESKRQWSLAKDWADNVLRETFVDRDLFLIISALYWGEGNKREFNIINSDPAIIKLVILGLIKIGLCISDVKLSLRVHNLDQIKEIKLFWSKYLNVPISVFRSTELVQGRKKGKLVHGMCRLRIKKGERYFKRISSVIDLFKSHSDAAIVQWIEQGTPKP